MPSSFIYNHVQTVTPIGALVGAVEDDDKTLATNGCTLGKTTLPTRHNGVLAWNWRCAARPTIRLLLAAAAAQCMILVGTLAPGRARVYNQLTPTRFVKLKHTPVLCGRICGGSCDRWGLSHRWD